MAPVNPESLMWAHQLKREHGHLLKRTKELESTSSKSEDRIKSLETAARSNANGDPAAVKELAKQIQAIDSNGIKQRLDGVEKEVNRKFDDAEAESEAMTMQIANLQQDKQLAEEERKATLTKDKALLKRIGEVEEGLKKYERTLDLIGKRVQGTRFEQIKEQLDGLTKQVMMEGEKMTLLTESVQALETANTELVKANEKLEKEVKAKTVKDSVERKRARNEASNDIAQADEPAEPGSSATKQKKSHKWAGGGADRDIIRQGSDLFGIKSNPKPLAPKIKTTAKKPDPPKSKKVVAPKKKIAIPRTPSEGSDRKSHKWAGGGADRDIIQAGLSLDSKRTGNQPSISTAAAPRDTPRTQAQKWAGDKKVVRAGPGWYEIEDSPTRETESPASSVPVKEPRGRPKKPVLVTDDGTPMKRPRGRPRKYPRSEEYQTQITATNSPSSNIQVEQAGLGSKKRSAAAAFEDSSPDPLGPPTKKSKASPEAGQHLSTGRKEPGIFSSPVSSSPPAHIAKNQADGHGRVEAVHGAAVAAASPSSSSSEESAPRPPRRQIVQLNEDISTIVRHMSG